jgi:hypothetical protein
MEETPQQQERIERYLRGELSGTERTRFTEALAEDPALQRRVALHRDLAAAFSDPEEERLRTTLRAVDADFPAQQRWWGMIVRNRWTIAATLLLLIAATIFWLVPNPPSNPAVLAIRAFEPYPIDVFRAGDPATTLPADILEPYRSGQFGLAAERIAARPDYATTAYWPFYRAVALIGAGRSDEAVPLLRELQARQALPGLKEAIDWYLALALLQTGETTAADNLLRTIAEQPAHYRRKEAKRLLNR